MYNPKQVVFSGNAENLNINDGKQVCNDKRLPRKRYPANHRFFTFGR
jgi:hypothetical protein